MQTFAQIVQTSITESLQFRRKLVSTIQGMQTNERMATNGQGGGSTNDSGIHDAPQFHQFVYVLWYTVLVVGIPCFLIGLCELGLRIGDYGASFDLFLPVPGHESYLYPNPNIGGLYFVHQDAPTILADYFRARSDESDIRLFVQGGSSAAGFPFYYGATFPHILENRIRRSVPDRHVDVVNTGMAAVNSFTLLDLAPQIIAQQPDAVLIYTGHNEYYGALGAGSSEHISGRRWLVRLYLRLLRFRTVQLLRDLLQSMLLINRIEASADQGQMELLARERTIPYKSDRYREGLLQLRENLSRLLALYKRHEIPVFVSTIASNERDQPPFVSSEDSLSADAAYAMAQILDSLDRAQAAREAYARAKDFDELRFRAPEDVNDLIREVAGAYGAVVVDARTSLASHAPNRIIGNELMTDHVHPYPHGYQVVADAFYHALAENGMLETTTPASPEGAERTGEASSSASLGRDVVLTEVDSLVGMYHILALKSRWPFTSRSRSVQLPTPQSFQEHLAQAVFSGRMRWDEANRSLIAYSVRRGDLENALVAARCRQQELPFLIEPYLTTARLQTLLSDFEGARRTLDRANDVEETWQAHALLADVLRRMHHERRAAKHRRRAQELRTDD